MRIYISEYKGRGWHTHDFLRATKGYINFYTFAFNRYHGAQIRDRITVLYDRNDPKRLPWNTFSPFILYLGVILNHYKPAYSTYLHISRKSVDFLTATMVIGRTSHQMTRLSKI